MLFPSFTVVCVRQKSHKGIKRSCEKYFKNRKKVQVKAAALRSSMNMIGCFLVAGQLKNEPFMVY